jgi:glycine/D-amino acid oxidase-like deaminating enzyme
VLSVQPGRRPTKQPTPPDLCPWLDGPGVAASSLMDADGGAQVAPFELCTKLMAAAQAAGAKLVIGSVEGISKRPAAAAAPTSTTSTTTSGGGGSGEGVAAAEAAEEASSALDEVTGVVLGDGSAVAGDAVVVCLGPWSSRAAAWLNLQVPITGIKSTSVVFQSPDGQDVEPFALFCGEDSATGGWRPRGWFFFSSCSRAHKMVGILILVRCDAATDGKLSSCEDAHFRRVLVFFSAFRVCYRRGGGG